jgi:hypothetical protein
MTRRPIHGVAPDRMAAHIDGPGRPPCYAHTLLATRLFVRDMALLAEGLVMADMHTAETAAAAIAAGASCVQPGGFWSFDADAPEGSPAEVAHRQAMDSRERYPFWAPDKVGEVSIRRRSRARECEVRRSCTCPHLSDKLPSPVGASGCIPSALRASHSLPVGGPHFCCGLPPVPDVLFKGRLLFYSRPNSNTLPPAPIFLGPPPPRRVGSPAQAALFPRRPRLVRHRSRRRKGGGGDALFPAE